MHDLLDSAFSLMGLGTAHAGEAMHPMTRLRL